MPSSAPPNPSSEDVLSSSSTVVTSPAAPKTHHALPSKQPSLNADMPDPHTPVPSPRGSHDDLPQEVSKGLQDQTNLLPLKQLIIVFLGLSIALFVSLLDQTMVSTALPTIGAEFGNSRQSPWVATAYLLTSTAFQPLYGRFSDIFGRKYTLIFALSLFMCGSLGSALSKTMIQLICLRALTGMGGGAVITLVMIIISDVVSLKERGKFQGITGTVVVLSNSMGPLIGGVFTQKASWRWVFWVNLPLGSLAIAVVVFVLPLKRVAGSWREKVGKIDYVGGLLILAGTISLLIPISWGGTEYAWSSVAVILPLILGICIYVAFGFVETKVAYPIIPLGMFKNITVLGVILSTLLSGCIFYVQLYYLPQYFQVVLGVSTIRSGVLLFPLIVPQTFFSFASGYLVSATGEYRWNLIAGFTIWTIGLGLLSTLTADSGMGKLIGYQVMAGAGAGQTFQAGLIAIQASVPRSQMAVATAARNFVRLLGGTIALAVSQALLNNAVQSTLTSSGAFSQAEIDSITAQPTAVHRSTTLSADQLALVLGAYTKGISHVWYFAIPCAGLSLFLAIFCIKHHDLTRDDDAAQKEAAKEWAARHKLSKEERHALDLEKGLVTGAQTPSTHLPHLTGKERRSLERAVERAEEEDVARRIETELVDGGERRRAEAASTRET